MRASWPYMVGSLAVLAGVVWLSTEVLRPCRLLDVWLARSGCVAVYQISDLTALGRALAFVPGGRSLLAVGGTRLVASSARDGADARAQIVFYDMDAKAELSRVTPRLEGRIDQFAVLPDADRLALTCNPIYTCGDRAIEATEDLRGATYVSLISRSGDTHWTVPIRVSEARPDAEGRAFTLDVASDGSEIIAGPVTLDADTGERVMLDTGRSVARSGPIDTMSTVSMAGVTADLDLPQDFVPFTRLQTALSFDGRRVATLSRRFSGRGAVRAILQVWDTASAGRLVRHEIEEDLTAAVVWHPDGNSIVVAVAAAPQIGSQTELRRYQAGATRR